MARKMNGRTDGARSIGVDTRIEHINNEMLSWSLKDSWELVFYADTDVMWQVMEGIAIIVLGVQVIKFLGLVSCHVCQFFF